MQDSYDPARVGSSLHELNGVSRWRKEGCWQIAYIERGKYLPLCIGG